MLCNPRHACHKHPIWMLDGPGLESWLEAAHSRACLFSRPNHDALRADWWLLFLRLQASAFFWWCCWRDVDNISTTLCRIGLQEASLSACPFANLSTGLHCRWVLQLLQQLLPLGAASNCSQSHSACCGSAYSMQTTRAESWSISASIQGSKRLSTTMFPPWPPSRSSTQGMWSHLCPACR